MSIAVRKWDTSRKTPKPPHFKQEEEQHRMEIETERREKLEKGWDQRKSAAVTNFVVTKIHDPMPAAKQKATRKKGAKVMTGGGLRIYQLDATMLSGDGDPDALFNTPQHVTFNELISPERIGVLTFSPSGRFIAAGSNDGHIYIVDIKKSSVMKTASAHSSYIRAVDWAADENMIQSTSGVVQDLLYFDVHPDSKSRGPDLCLQSFVRILLRIAC